MPKRRTMYMHTLDGKPARVIRSRYKRRDHAYLVATTPGVRTPLHSSLAACRADWNECLVTFAANYRSEHPFANDTFCDARIADELQRYGYVLVEVPS